MKLALFTVMLPHCTLEQSLDILKRSGYDGVEWRVAKVNPALAAEEPSFWGNNRSTVDVDSDMQFLEGLRSETERRGLTVPNLGSYLPTGDLSAVERDMLIAIALGAPSIRVGVPAYDRSRKYQELLAEGRSYLEGVQSLSRKYGIKGLIEIHMGNIATSASGARRLVEGMDPSCIGVIHDAGNMVFEGYENYKMGLEILGEYLAHVHIKNARWVCEPSVEGVRWKAEPAPIQEGAADLKQLLVDLKNIGYDGWLSLEDFSDQAVTEERLASIAAYLRN
ncbi:sugar phosphate isomerase/epimerase family protein [Paenibacillus roseipurpureus]|uniref:Sugar phosphate isomerase/epimerase n=1 Tax=Paenibacillus roseopurpureus TaxID=2918901 RepID=A0AA96RLS4_9BACL|nr:sugar phosphate isomerase/epimerase [Paenibacillus sp. MBLB1832]WNR45980.1 sugar phosphate isomerase/epimerase [Paenibacillus sp. MBLB1832]